MTGCCARITAHPSSFIAHFWVMCKRSDIRRKMARQKCPQWHIPHKRPAGGAENGRAAAAAGGGGGAHLGVGCARQQFSWETAPRSSPKEDYRRSAAHIAGIVVYVYAMLRPQQLLVVDSTHFLQNRSK
jgi:hypothetical protein